MESRTPVLLVVQVETVRLRWFVAALGLDGQLTPLLCSEVGDLDKYKTLDFDEQVAFLRHRFCGVLQRGCDRLYPRGLKASHFVFLFEEPLPEPTGELTERVAEHFAVWMLNPPAVVFLQADAASRLVKVAGDLDAPLTDLLQTRLSYLLAARNDAAAWELSRKKPG
jgi:hypothetical protein